MHHQRLGRLKYKSVLRGHCSNLVDKEQGTFAPVDIIGTCWKLSAQISERQPAFTHFMIWTEVPQLPIFVMPSSASDKCQEGG